MTIALAIWSGPVASARGEDGAVVPPYDDAVLSEIAQEVLTGSSPSEPEASVPDAAVAAAAARAAAASTVTPADVASAPEPESGATDLEPAVEGVTVAIPAGLVGSRVKPDAASTSAYRSNSFRQRGSAPRALSFSSGAIAVASGLDAALQSKADVARSAGRDHVYGFVLLRAPLDESVEGKLEELGVRLLGRHDDHYKARLPIASLPAIAALREVEWVGVSSAEQKQSSELTQLRFARAATPAVDETSPVPVIINLFEADDSGEFARAIEEAGAALGEYDADLNFYRAVVTGPVLERLQQLDFVLFVDLIGLNPAGHDQSAPLLDADLIRPGSVTYGVPRFGGAPVPVGVIDSGASIYPNGHMDLTSKRACGRNFTTKPDGPYVDRFGHGTHVLGTIAGTGTADPRFKGIAPGVGDWLSGGFVRLAKVWDENGQGNTDTVLMDAMDWMTLPGECTTSPVDPAPMVINYSGGEGTNLTGTDPISRKADYRTWINAQLYVVCSGNGGGVGTIGKPGVAKNVLAVGNVLDNGYQTVGDRKPTSSQGPTGDGRMKPNVVAPGTSITSAKAGTTNEYKPLDGCSMATPHVTGLAASLMEHYPVFQFKPALMRAHLMATAMGHDGAVGMSNEYGLGRVSGYVAHWDHTNSDGWQTTRHWGTINSNGFAYGDVVVPAGAKRLVIVMTWDEPPASAGASRAVINDIDLYVDRNVDCSDPTGACGEYVSVSTVDNVEYVVVHDPLPGTYRMKVVPTDASPTIMPWGMSAVVIRGDVLPGARTVSPPAMRTYGSGPTTVQVGSLINVSVGVANDSYVASGVQVGPISVPNGVLPLESETTRLDGGVMKFPSNQASITLGNIPPSWSRTATYAYLAQTPGTKTFSYRVWSENSGEQTVTRTVNVVSGSLSSDLMVTSMGSTPGAPSGAPGAKFTATSTVYNAGTSAAGASKTRYYLSSDAAKSADDTPLTGTRSVAGLQPGASLSGSVTVTIPASAPTGVFFLLACADDANTVGETDEANNCTAGPGATVTVGSPDLVEGAVSAPPATKARGTSFSVSDTAQNLGSVASAATKTRYYLSLDAQKSASDTLLTGVRAVPALAAGASHTGSKSVKIPPSMAAGSYYVLACADDMGTASESSEGNNCTASSTKVTVTP